MTECIEPELIGEGELVAYVEGAADKRVRDHVARCVACAARVARLRQTSHALLSLMYRASCPAPEILGKYELDLLSSGERLKIGAHVRTCHHCRQELDELAAAEDKLIQRVLGVIQGAVRVVEGALATPPRLHPVEMRGERAGQQAFHGADLDVLIGFQATASGKRKGTLVGSVLQEEAVAGSQAWLFQEGEEPRPSPVDELGTFSFEGIESGEYAVALEVGEAALLMRKVVAGGP